MKPLQSWDKYWSYGKEFQCSLWILISNGRYTKRCLIGRPTTDLPTSKTPKPWGFKTFPEEPWDLSLKPWYLGNIQKNEKTKRLWCYTWGVFCNSSERGKPGLPHTLGQWEKYFVSKKENMNMKIAQIPLKWQENE